MPVPRPNRHACSAAKGLPQPPDVRVNRAHVAVEVDAAPRQFDQQFETHDDVGCAPR